MVASSQAMVANPANNALDPESLRQLFEEAQTLLAAKQPDQALTRLRDILELSPNHPDALNFASVAFGQLNMLDEAIDCSRQAIARRPNAAGYHLNLANRLNDLDRRGPALESYQQALALDPKNVPALKSRFRCLVAGHRWADVPSAVEQLLAVINDDAELTAECALACVAADQKKQALALYQQALDLEADRLDWLLQLARLAIGLEDLDLAKATGEHVLTLTDQPEMHAMLASIMHRSGDLDGMEEHLNAVPEESDQAGNAANLMGMLKVSQGKMREGLDIMAKNDVLSPDIFILQATRLMYLNYDPDLPVEDLQKAHFDVGQHFRDSLPKLNQNKLGLPHDPDRRLRIGFVSPDLRAHSVAYFVRPYFAAFDRENFDIVAYAHLSYEDEVSQGLKDLVTTWRNVFELGDQALAEQIRNDRIDILIDLTGYTRDTRLCAFTARPAPIQMTYIGYPNTTGMPAIDYRITDWIADPEGVDDHYSETLIRLPGCFLSYAVPYHAPDLKPGPAELQDYVTFGSFNNFAKINPDVIALWAKVLDAVPSSRLLLKSPHSGDPKGQAVYRSAFEREGVDPSRIRFCAYQKSPKEHLAVYNDIDIALDTFPYNGTTTTCEALWMGVPVVTLCGERHASRVGASLLNTIGFPAGVAHSEEDYVMTARLLAENRGMLKTARRTLRETILQSPLCDSQLHAQTLERAFRAVWQIWCEQQQSN